MSSHLTATNWKPLHKGSLRGFADIEMPSGLVIREVSVLETNGKCWASPPSKPMLDRDGHVMIDDAGKRRYVPIIDFRDRETRAHWSAAVIAALRAAFPEALDVAPPPPTAPTWGGVVR